MAMNADVATNIIIEGLNQKKKEELFNQWLHDPIRFEKSFDDYIEVLKPYRKSTNDEKEDILKKYGGV